MIRKVKRNELKEIANLYFLNMKENFENVGEIPISAKDFGKLLLENINKSKIFVLDDNGIKGFIWYFDEDEEYNLEEIFSVDKKKGYGAKLIEYLLEDAKKNNIHKINLDIHFKNVGAQKFFEKFGFSKRTIEMSLDL